MSHFTLQAALHVKGGAAQAANATVEWAECSRAIRYNMTDGRTPMMPIYSELLNATNAHNLKILVYSGDDDMVCATEGSQEWIYALGFETDPNRAWHAWHYDDDAFGRQVGGFVANFQEDHMSGHFAFVTAHGCGHEVPTYKPQLALELFKNYLAGRVYV
jgi:carboxypeptidase C (cathepsin A)